MIRFLGCALVILSGGLIGLTFYSDLVRIIRSVEQMQRILERFRTEVCIRLRPLPEAAASAFADAVCECPDSEELTMKLGQLSFAQVWEELVRSVALPNAAEEAAVRLGQALAAGEPGERAFDVCLKELDRIRDLLREKAEKNRRLYAPVGFSAGCLAALLLL